MPLFRKEVLSYANQSVYVKFCRHAVLLVQDNLFPWYQPREQIILCRNYPNLGVETSYSEFVTTSS